MPMSTLAAHDQEPDPEELMREYVKNRGDIFEEWHFMAKYIPRTIELQHDASGYILKNEAKSTSDQDLSLPMRELGALCMLCAKGDLRFAANHVRRLYRAGITNAVIFEAAEAVAPVVGHSTISLVAQAIMLANDPKYPFGKMPEGGEPKELTPFPEMKLGREPSKPQAQLADSAVWKYALAIDPEFAKRTVKFVDHCNAIGRTKEHALGRGVRALISIAALCARGQKEMCAEQIRIAYDYGLTKRQVLEAVSLAQNMTGAASSEIGIQAMMMVDADK
jgi:alkylhydroperoxidase/carboxymuconolactone decarboxylase family protein YurZ